MKSFTNLLWMLILEHKIELVVTFFLKKCVHSQILATINSFLENIEIYPIHIEKNHLKKKKESIQLGNIIVLPRQVK
jgi:hypothetical protein